MQVQYRTGHSGEHSSHVMQYGDMSFRDNFLSTFMGNNPTSNNTSTNDVQQNSSPLLSVVSQRDADLLHFWHKVLNYCFLIKN